jgi:hypothetical protein
MLCVLILQNPQELGSGDDRVVYYICSSMLYMCPHTTKPAGVGVGRCVSELAGYIDRVLRDDGNCHAVKKKNA